MSKWIDYDAIDYRNDRLHDKSEEFLNGVIYMAQRIEEAPSIDIVRCRECKYWQPHEQYGYDEDNDEYHDYCALLVPEDDYYAVTRKADDFCSYGEREDE